MTHVRFEPEAQNEFDAAVEWYGSRSQFVALRFVDAVQEGIDAILLSPEAWSLAPYVERALGVRRHLLRRFPYALVYILIAEEVRILAVAHLRRRPGYWRGRAGR